MTSKINVHIRIRPGTDTIISVENNTLTVGNKVYTFDTIYDINCTQQVLFNDIRPMLDNTIAGFNSTVFVYGQTGSGKTYTMGMHTDGLSRRDGIMPMSLWYLIDQLKEQDQWSMAMSFVEIYNEEVRDLFGNKAGVHLRERNGEVQMAGVREIEIRDVEEAFDILVNACRERTTKSTKMNSTSSRSHAVLTINLKQRVEKRFLISHVRFIDLAGSERVKRTGVSRDLKSANGTFLESKESTMRESISINTGLLALGNVISALSKKMRHIPFRDSKLTRLLQPSLTGSYNTLMIACISPCSVDMYETQNTLKYALRATNISLSVRRNITVDLGQVNVMELKKEIHNLREENMRLRESSSFRSLKMRVEALENENRELKAELTRLRAFNNNAVNSNSKENHDNKVNSNSKETYNNIGVIEEVSFIEPEYLNGSAEDSELNNRGFNNDIQVDTREYHDRNINKEVIDKPNELKNENLNIESGKVTDITLGIQNMATLYDKLELQANESKKVKVEDKAYSQYQQIFGTQVENINAYLDKPKQEESAYYHKCSLKVSKKIRGPAIQAIGYYRGSVVYGTLDGYVQCYDPVADTELSSVPEPMAIRCIKSSDSLLLYGFGRTLKIHSGDEQLSCVYDADISCIETQGSFIFTGHENGMVQIRDIRYLTPDAVLKRIQLHRGTVFGITAAATGIYTASRDHSVGVIQTTQPVYADDDCIDTKTLREGQLGHSQYKKNLLAPPHYDSVHFVLEYCDSIISGSRDCSIKRWVGGQVAKTIPYAHNSWIKAGVAMDTCFVTGCKGGVVMAWRLGDGSLRRVGKSKVESVQCMVRAGSAIAVGCARSLNILRIRE